MSFWSTPADSDPLGVLHQEVNAAFRAHLLTPIQSGPHTLLFSSFRFVIRSNRSKSVVDDDLFLVGAMFHLIRNDSELKFNWHPIRRPQNHNSTIEVLAARNATGSFLAQVAQKWDFLSSNRLTLIDTIAQFLAWWRSACEHPETLIRQRVENVTAMTSVGLPDDVLKNLLLLVGELDAMRLSLASRAWKALLDREEDWAIRWSASAYSLNRASLSRCPTFKSRFGLIHLARRNISQRRGLLHPLVTDRTSAQPSRYSGITFEPIFFPTPADFVGHKTCETSFGGSYTSTTILAQQFTDLTNWPERPFKAATAVGHAKGLTVGRQIIAEPKGSKFDVSDFLNQPKADSKIHHTPLGFSSYNTDRILPNTDPAYPWLIVLQARNGKSKLRIVDVHSCESLPVENPSEGVSLVAAAHKSGDGGGRGGTGHRSATPRPVAFHGPHLLLRVDDVCYYMKFVEEEMKFTTPNSLEGATSLLNIESEHKSPLRQLLLTIDCGIFFAMGDSGHGNKPARIVFCQASELHRPWVEIEELLRRNVIDIYFQTKFVALRASKSLLACGSGTRTVIVDLHTKRTLSVLQGRKANKEIYWIDDTILAIANQDFVDLIDFAARSAEASLDLLAPSLPLPQLEMAILEFQEEAKTAVVRRERIEPRFLSKALQVLFGEQWSSETSLLALEPPEINSCDNARRPQTFVLCRGAGNKATDVKDFIAAWEAVSHGPLYSWLSEEEARNLAAPPSLTSRGAFNRPRANPSAEPAWFSACLARVDAVSFKAQNRALCGNAGILCFPLSTLEAQEAFAAAKKSGMIFSVATL